MGEASEWKQHISCSKASVLIKNVCDCDLNCDVISETVQFSTNKRNENVKTDTAKRSLKLLEETLLDKRNNLIQFLSWYSMHLWRKNWGFRTKRTAVSVNHPASF